MGKQRRTVAGTRKVSGSPNARGVTLDEAAVKLGYADATRVRALLKSGKLKARGGGVDAASLERHINRGEL